MRCTWLFVFLTTLGLSESIHALTKIKKSGRELPNRNLVQLEKRIIAKRFKHSGHIAQQGYNNGTIKLHLSDESGASGNAKRLQNDRGHIVQQRYNDGTMTLHMGDETKEFNFGPNNGNNGTVVQQGTNKGEVDETVTRKDGQKAKRENDPSTYMFKVNNGTIGQQGVNKGEIRLKSKPKNGTIAQQGLNQGTIDFTDKPVVKREYGTKDKFVFKGNNGTIAQQGESSGHIELKTRDEEGRAKRQFIPEKFKFGSNNGSIEQEGKNFGEVDETITRDYNPKANGLNDPKDYSFKSNNGTIIQQGLNKGTIRLQGKPYVGNIPQQGKNEGKILYNGKKVKPRDAPGQFNFAGKSGTAIDQRGTNTGKIKEQE